MADTQGNDSGPSERPSFLSFLKKGKGKQKREAEEGEGRGGGGGSSTSGNKTNNSPLSNNGSPEKQGEQLTKAQVRRAQVRKAQIEHRQRKANYVKQLEMDISQLRELITQAQRDTHTLKSENGDIRAIMGKNGIPTPPELTQGQVSQATTTTSPSEESKSPVTYPPQEGQEPFLPDSLATTEEELTVTLSTNKTMGTPAFSVSPNYSNTSFLTLSSPATWTSSQLELSPQQELVVVNFVLALEHVCWDHFWVGDCHNHSQQTEEEKGHTLMASSYVMANAPESVYRQRDAFTSRFRPSPTLQWQSSAVMLDSLYGLAQCLNPGGEEVAPVQAWFELASRYPIDVLLQPATLVTLMRELKGVVRCVAFGAAMEREAFESVALRVLGPPTGGLQLAE